MRVSKLVQNLHVLLSQSLTRPCNTALTQAVAGSARPEEVEHPTTTEGGGITSQHTVSPKMTTKMRMLITITQIFLRSLDVHGRKRAGRRERPGKIFCSDFLCDTHLICTRVGDAMTARRDSPILWLLTASPSCRHCTGRDRERRTRETQPTASVALEWLQRTAPTKCAQDAATWTTAAGIHSVLLSDR